MRVHVTAAGVCVCVEKNIILHGRAGLGLVKRSEHRRVQRARGGEITDSIFLLLLILLPS